MPNLIVWHFLLIKIAYLFFDMAQNPNNTERKYIAIRKRYRDLKNQKKNGVQLYTHQYIMSVLKIEFFLEVATLENIVWQKVG